MYFNRWDVCLAWYLYLVEYHSGMDSWEYRRLSRLLRFFRPPQRPYQASDLSDNARAIYDRLVEEHQC